MKSKTNSGAGKILSGIIALGLVGSAISKIAGVPQVVNGLVHAGIPANAIVPIALLELTCLALYLVPRTIILGTLLLTGYLGGATVTHLIGGENLLPPLLAGILIWGGTYLRVAEFRKLLPLRNGQPPETAASERAPQRVAVRG